jgi:hypothetical protein
MDDHKVKILYIAGWGRSGSTILARILGQVDGIFHTGELRTVWVDGFKSRSICGCGEPLRACKVWSRVFESSFGGFDKINPLVINRLRNEVEPRSQDLLKLMLPFQQFMLDVNASAYLGVLKNLYKGISKETGNRVIVDDSNHPGYAYLLSRISSLDIYLIHLIRDARGCAYSWFHRRKKGLGYYSIKDSAAGWSLRNLSIESLRKQSSVHYRAIKYEDFLLQPKQTIADTLNFLGHQSNGLSFITEDSVFLNTTHSVFGNDNRINTGEIKLKVDNTWTHRMKSQDKLKVVALTWPLLLKYGYPIWI